MHLKSPKVSQDTGKLSAFGIIGAIDLFYVFIFGFFLGIVPEIIHSGFYFMDDMQHQYMPAFYNLGRALRNGEFPILTLAHWEGSNYFAEYQYALLNPVSLLTYIILPSFSSYNLASSVLASFYQGILASGFYYLARTYGIDRPLGWLLALLIATNNFVAYWLASSWFPGFISMAWAVWAWAFFIRADRSAKYWLMAVLFSYLTLSSGWPFTDFFWALIVVAIMAQKWLEKNINGTLAILLAALGALLLAMPSFLALFSIGHLTTRMGTLSNNSVCVPCLQDTLAMSFPFHRGFLYCGIAGLFKQTAVPFFMCAWFIFPILPFLRWKELAWKSAPVLTLVALSCFLLLATLGPDQLIYLKLPYRFIPYLHMSFLLLVALMIDRAGLRPIDRQTVLSSFGLIFLGAFMAWQRNPSLKLMLPMTVGHLLAWAVFLKAWSKDKKLGLLALGVCAFAFFVATRIVYPVNTDNLNLNMNPQRQETALGNGVPESYTFYLGSLGKRENYNRLNPDRLQEYQTGNMSLEYGIPSIGGYTPIGHAFLEVVMCLTIFSETCPLAAYHLFANPDLETGAPTVDLFRINRIIAMKGAHLKALESYMPKKEWRLERDGRLTQTFVRDLPNAGLPGTVSWASPGLRLEGIGKPKTLLETVQVTQRSGGKGKVVFARLWWPGYKATFAGAEVPVRASHGIFVTVDLPNWPETGTLTLSYRPPKLGFSIFLALFGLMLCFLTLLFFRNIRTAE